MHHAGMLGSEETTCTTRTRELYIYERRPHCTTRTEKSYMWREITDFALFLPSGIYDHLSHIIQCPRLSKLMQIICQL